MAIWDDISGGIKSLFGIDDEEKRKQQQISTKSNTSSINTSNSKFNSGNLNDIKTGFTTNDNSAQIEAENERKRQEEERRKAEEERKRQEAQKKADEAKKAAEAQRLAQIREKQSQSVLGSNNANVLGMNKSLSLDASQQNKASQEQANRNKAIIRENNLQEQANRYGMSENSNEREKLLREQTNKLYDEKLDNEQKQASFLDKTFRQDQLKKRAYDQARSQAIRNQAEQLNYEDQESTEALNRGVDIQRLQAQKEARQAQEDLKLENIAKNALYHTANTAGSIGKGFTSAATNFMPKTAEALTSGVANTIKFVDEDNEFANKLLNNIQKDRENNEIRKFVENRTRVNEQDNKLAHSLSEGATNLAIDSGLGIGTGSVVPAALHGLSTHQQTMEDLNAIEERKKSEAEARGEEYNPSDFRERYLAAAGNAGVQAALEKAGIDKILKPFKGLDKNLAGKALSGFISEGTEEGAQQFVDNATKRIFNDKQDLGEGVAESAILGGILGAAGAGVYGKADREIPSTREQVSQAGDKILNSKPLNQIPAIQDRNLRKALNEGTDNPIYYGKMPSENISEVNQIRSKNELSPVNSNIYAHPGAVEHIRNRRIDNDGLDARDVVGIARDAIYNDSSNIYESKYPQNQVSANTDGRKAANVAYLGEHNNDLSLKSIYRQPTKNILEQKNNAIGANNLVSSAVQDDAGLASNGRTEVTPRQLADNFTEATTTDSIAENENNVNVENTLELAKDYYEEDENGISTSTWISPNDLFSENQIRILKKSNDPRIKAVVQEYTERSKHTTETKALDNPNASTNDGSPNATAGTARGLESSNATNIEAQPSNQNNQQFNNVPLKGNNALTKGNLYTQTKFEPGDVLAKPFVDGAWEYRYHQKRKDGKLFNSFERRYVGDSTDIPGDWQPYSRAAYTWYTQKGKIDKVNNNDIVIDALAQARRDGEVRDYIASLDEKGNNKISPLRGELTLDGGFVRDPQSGAIIGNHIQVTPFGVINQTAGKLEVYDNELLDGFDKNKSGVFDTFNRAAEKNSSNQGSEDIAKDLYYSKTIAADKYVSELNEINKKHQEIVNEVDKVRPKGVTEKDFWEDIGRFTEGKFSTNKKLPSLEAFSDKYGTTAAEAVQKYDDYMRKQYNSIIDQANEVRRMYGKDEIEYRKNYMPHIMQDGSIDGISGLLPVNWQTGVHNELQQSTRGEIPAHMVGTSENTKPGKKFNVHELRRKGASEYVRDPRIAFEKYAETTLYNKHMEPVIAKGRSLESAMRASSYQTQASDKSVKDIKRYRGDNNISEGDISPRMTLAVTDFVNELAGKSNALDRPFTDRANKSMQIIRKLESMNGANKIAGNISSTFAQALNLPETVRDNGLKNTGKAIISAFDNNTKAAMNESSFLKERYTDSGNKFSKKTGQKASEFISKASGMDFVERKFIELNWGANYQRLKSEGLRDFQLIKTTDQATERAVGGRGIGAMPQAYRSTVGKMFLQFTYETNESFKNDIEHAKGIVKNVKSGDAKIATKMTAHAAESFVIGIALNALYGMVTGNEPLPDLFGAIKDSLDNANKNDEDETKQSPIAYGAAQIGGEIAKANPISSAALNLIPKTQRQNIFGTDNDFGRFDGATGVAQLGGNILGLVGGLASGDGTEVKKNALGLIPGGSQVKKTTEAIDSLRKGYTSTGEGDNEKKQAKIDNNNPLKWIQGSIFGKNALSEQQDFYNSKSSATPVKAAISKDNAELLNKIKSEQGEESVSYNSLKNALDRQSRLKNDDNYKDSFAKFNDDTAIKIAKGDLVQSEDGLIRNQNGEIDRNFYKNYSKLIENEKGSENYYLAKKAAMTLNDNLSNSDVDILMKKSEMGGDKDDTGTSEWAKYIYSNEGKSAEYQVMLANYNNNKLNNNLSAKEQVEMPSKLKRAEVQSSFNKIDRDGYGLTGNFDNTQAYLDLQETDEGKEQMRANLNAINAKMLETGLITQKTYNSRYKNINGVSGSSSSSSKKKSSGSSSDTFSAPNLPEFSVKSAPKYKNTTNKGKGIIKGLTINNKGTVSVKSLPRVKVNQ